MKTRLRMLVAAIAALGLMVPAAAVAQEASPSQASGPNEYGEQGVPTPTGETEDPTPVEEDTTDDTPAPTTDTSPDTSSAPAATPAPTATTAAVEDTSAELPRTGAESWAVALIGIALLAAGLLIRRREIAAPGA